METPLCRDQNSKGKILNGRSNETWHDHLRDPAGKGPRLGTIYMAVQR